MTHFNRVFLSFSTLLLFGLLCNARPVLDKRKSTAREVFDTRSHTPPTLGQPITNVSSPIILQLCLFKLYLSGRI